MDQRRPAKQISLIETFQNQARVQQQLEKPDFSFHPVGPCNSQAGAWAKCSFKELRRGRGERSLHCSDQGQPIWLISAEDFLCNLTRYELGKGYKIFLDSFSSLLFNFNSQAKHFLKNSLSLKFLLRLFKTQRTLVEGKKNNLIQS